MTTIRVYAVHGINTNRCHTPSQAASASIGTLKMVKIRADLNYLIGRSPAPTIKRLK